jgi:hypothetical protein
MTIAELSGSSRTSPYSNRKTGYGVVGLLYPLGGGSQHPNRLIDDLQDQYGTSLSYRFASIVAPQFQWDFWDLS